MPDWDAFRRWAVLKKDYRPSVVKKTRRHLEFLRDEWGLDLDNFTVQGAEDVLFRRAEADVTDHAFNGDVRVLNRFVSFATGKRGPFERRRIPRKQKTILTWPQIRAVLTYQHPGGNEEIGLRRRALAHFSLSVTLRRSELGALRRGHLLVLDGEHYVRVASPAKRGPVRDLWLPGELFHPNRPFSTWLRYLDNEIGHDMLSEPDAVWAARDNIWRREEPLHAMTGDAVGQEFSEVARELGFPFNPTIARRTRNTMLRHAKVAPEYRKEGLGHQGWDAFWHYEGTITREELARHMREHPSKSLFREW